jgi:O-antigen/teichoic acid export membrane protein
MSKLLKHSAIYVTLGFLPVAANFFLAPIYTRFLTPEQYALVGMSTLFQAFLTFFMSLSLDGAFSRMYFKYERREKYKNGLLSTLLITSFLASAIVFVVLYFIGDDLFKRIFSTEAFRFSNFGYWVAILTYGNVVYLFFALYYRNAEKIRSYILLNTLFFFVPVAGTLTGLIFFKQGALGAVIGRAVGSLVVALPPALFFLSKTKFTVIKGFIRPAMKYALPIIPYQLIFAGFLYLDRFFLLYYFTPHDFGVYNFAALLSGVIPVFLNAISNATNPAIYRELTKGEDLVKVQRFNQMIVFVAILLISTCVAFVVPAMRLVISKEYAASYPYVGLIFLSYLPYVHYLIFSVPLFFWGKTKPFPVIAACSLLAGLAFNIVLIPRIGIWAVCLSLFSIRITQLGTAYLFNRKLGYAKLEYIQQGRFILTSAVICGIYTAVLFLNARYDLFPVDFVNLIPIAGFGISIPLLYRKEMFAINEVVGKTLRSGASRINLLRK